MPASQFSHAIPFASDQWPDWDFAEAIMATLGFQLAAKSDSCREWLGPGMTSSRENALIGCSRLRLEHVDQTLTGLADLGQVDRLAQLFVWLPRMIVLLVTVILVTVFWATFGLGVWVGVVFSIASIVMIPFLVISPFMRKLLRRRTEQAIRTFMTNLAMRDSKPLVASAEIH